MLKPSLANGRRQTADGRRQTVDGGRLCHSIADYVHNSITRFSPMVAASARRTIRKCDCEFWHQIPTGERALERPSARAIE
jgi:hypothetical protein